MGQIQDSTVGCFEMTRANVEMDELHAMCLYQTCGMDPPVFTKGPDYLYGGAEAVSVGMMMYAPINYDRKTQWFDKNYSAFMDYDPREIRLQIERGRIIQGVFDKKKCWCRLAGQHLPRDRSDTWQPPSTPGHVHAAADGNPVPWKARASPSAPATFASPLPTSRRFARSSLRRCMSPSSSLTACFRAPSYRPSAQTTQEYYEQLQIEALRHDDRMLGPLLRSIYPNSNGLFRMIGTKSKGSINNIFHIMGVVGQITINGKRLKDSFSGRPSPYSHRFGTDPGAYGYVQNNYVNGMTPSEFISSGMNGRYDLISKALTTAESGYMQRKSNLANQSSFVEYHRRVQKDVRIASFLYGENGLDPRAMEKVTFRTCYLNDAALTQQYYFDADRRAGLLGDEETLRRIGVAMDEEFAQVRLDRDEFRAVSLRFEGVSFNRPMSDRVQMPVNVERIMKDVLIDKPYDPPAQIEANMLLDMMDQVREFVEELPYVFMNENCRKRRVQIPAQYAAATSFMRILVRMHLCSRKLVHISPEHLQWALDLIYERYSLALVHYGEAVGKVAVQSISEPLTQYMLDSHHRSVKGGTSKAGLVRVAEIYGAKPVSAERSPEMLLQVRGDLGRDRAAVQRVANSIEIMRLNLFLEQQIQILFETYGVIPGNAYPANLADRQWVSEFEEAHPLLKVPHNLTNWCLRFRISKHQLALKGMELRLIITRLQAAFPGAFLVHTGESAPEIIIRAYLSTSLFNAKKDGEEQVHGIVDQFRQAIIRGIPRVHSTEVVPMFRHGVQEDGSLVKEKLFGIRCIGTNLYGVLGNPHIDPLTVTSTSIGDTFSLLGIEAARQKIISELDSFMGDSAPSACHLMVYADEMCRLGRVTSIEPGGLIHLENNDCLLRMAMSNPISHLKNAALAGHAQRVSSPSATLIVGGAIRHSTEVIVDVDFVRDNMPSDEGLVEALR